MKAQFILPTTVDRRALIESISRKLSELPTNVGYRLEVHEHRANRSSQQNRYLWGVVYPSILEQGGETLGGWTAEDLHEFFLGEHFGWEMHEGFGQKRKRPIRRSSRLSKTEFADFIAFIQRRMAEHGIVVPDPDPDYFLHEEAA